MCLILCVLRWCASEIMCMYTWAFVVVPAQNAVYFEWKWLTLAAVAAAIDDALVELDSIGFDACTDFGTSMTSAKKRETKIYCHFSTKLAAFYMKFIPLVDSEWMTCADALASFAVVTVSNGTWFVVVEQLCIEKIHRWIWNLNEEMPRECEITWRRSRHHHYRSPNYDARMWECSAVAETLNESSGQHRRSYHWLVYVHCFAEHSPIYLAETKCRQIKWKWWIQLNIPGFIQINCLLIHWRTWFKLCICRICNGTAVRGIMISSIGDLPNMCCWITTLFSSSAVSIESFLNLDDIKSFNVWYVLLTAFLLPSRSRPTLSRSASAVTSFPRRNRRRN